MGREEGGRKEGRGEKEEGRRGGRRERGGRERRERRKEEKETGICDVLVHFASHTLSTLWLSSSCFLLCSAIFATVTEWAVFNWLISSDRICRRGQPQTKTKSEQQEDGVWRAK